MVDGATGSDGLTITGDLGIYDASTNSWSTGAPIPVPEAAAAVLDGQLYVVGDCDSRAFCGTSEVFRYDPASNAWQRLPDYPTPESWLGCGAIEGIVYCAGGQQSFGKVSRATYAYDPVTDTLSPQRAVRAVGGPAGEPAADHGRSRRLDAHGGANVSVKGGRANVRDLTVTPSQC